MALVKCPRCELNYILDGGTLCSVCRREVKGEHEIIDAPEMCSVCGENPAVPGGDLCLACLREMNGHPTNMDEQMVTEASIGIDSVSSMDEIELDLVDESMASEYGAEDEFQDDDEDQDGDEEKSEDDMPLSTDALADDEYNDDEDDEEDDDQ